MHFGFLIPRGVKIGTRLSTNKSYPSELIRVTTCSKRVKAVVFDACPPKSDEYAFSGFLSWVTQKPWVKTDFAWLFR
jgi:hypothetical protein